MPREYCVNTHDQLVRAGGGIAIIENYSGVQHTTIHGYLIYKIDARGQVCATDKQAPWYHRNMKVFLPPAASHLSFKERQAHAFANAAAWVKQRYGEEGPWVRNRLRDYVPARIHKAYPLRPQRRVAHKDSGDPS